MNTIELSSKAKKVLRNGLILVLLSPILLTILSTIKQFAEIFQKTGVIGDTIGGTTSPIVGLINAILLYYAFRAQLDANNQIQQQRKEDADYKKLEIIYTEVSYRVNNFRFIIDDKAYFGRDAFFHFFDITLNSNNNQYLQKTVLHHEASIQEFSSVLFLLIELQKQFDDCKSPQAETYKILFIHIINFHIFPRLNFLLENKENNETALTNAYGKEASKMIISIKHIKKSDIK